MVVTASTLENANEVMNVDWFIIDTDYYLENFIVVGKLSLNERIQYCESVLNAG